MEVTVQQELELESLLLKEMEVTVLHTAQQVLSHLQDRTDSIPLDMVMEMLTQLETRAQLVTEWVQSPLNQQESIAQLAQELWLEPVLKLIEVLELQLEQELVPLQILI
jgi:hypothetical protein